MLDLANERGHAEPVETSTHQRESRARSRWRSLAFLSRLCVARPERICVARLAMRRVVNIPVRRAPRDAFSGCTVARQQPSPAQSLPINMANGHCEKDMWRPVIDLFGGAGLAEREATLEIEYVRLILQLVIAAAEQSVQSPPLQLLVQHARPALAEHEQTGLSERLSGLAETLTMIGSFPQLDRAPMTDLPAEVTSTAADTAHGSVYTTVEVDGKRYVIGPVRTRQHQPFRRARTAVRPNVAAAADSGTRRCPAGDDRPVSTAAALLPPAARRSAHS